MNLVLFCFESALHNVVKKLPNVIQPIYDNTRAHLTCLSSLVQSITSWPFWYFPCIARLPISESIAGIKFFYKGREGSWEGMGPPTSPAKFSRSTPVPRIERLVDDYYITCSRLIISSIYIIVRAQALEHGVTLNITVSRMLNNMFTHILLNWLTVLALTVSFHSFKS